MSKNRTATGVNAWNKSVITRVHRSYTQYLSGINTGKHKQVIASQISFGDIYTVQQLISKGAFNKPKLGLLTIQ